MNEKTNIASLRLNYLRHELLEQDVLDNPIKQFEKWFQEALQAKILEPNAMTLSTISDNRPASRIVLLKGVDEAGFMFYTNYKSHKGCQIEENGFAALTFFWGDLERQVRIEGQIEKVSTQESDEYFAERPRGSQIGAWVSEQSKVISREELNERMVYFEEKFRNTLNIPRPEHWGGYRLIPDKIEFWQGRPSRLHDRILYTQSDESWKIERLSP
jgi:pyridoxamine 5'-phosphate oxidase